MLQFRGTIMYDQKVIWTMTVCQLAENDDNDEEITSATCKKLIMISMNWLKLLAIHHLIKIY